ncbi:MAG: hypothetical protein HRU19_14980 [Pseudobacteriovorax sp.]|nr:hypothetical protein [Pseudobacteriovorax sp.]
MFRSIFFVISISFAGIWSFQAEASQIQACKKIKQSKQAEVAKKKRSAKRYCTVKPALGSVGDYVEIKNQYNYIVAQGRVVKRGRTSSMIVLSKYKRDLGSMAGFPVMIKDNDSHDFWTATTAPF